MTSQFAETCKQTARLVECASDGTWVSRERHFLHSVYRS